MPVIVALDAGTGGAKCAVFDPDGRLRAARSEAWGYSVVVDPHVPFIKAFAFDPDQFWAALCRCARQAFEAAGAAPGDVVGIAATSQREGCVFLDAQGKELYAGPNLDSRAFQEGVDVLQTLGPERLYEITGHSAPFIFPLARYLWFRKHDPRPLARILMINDWMTYRLCDEQVAEPSNATESMLFDLRRRAWSEEILQRFDIPASVLPPIRRSGERVGSLGAAAAAATGLAAGTAVFAGGADTQCALLGAGAVEDGDTAAILGTTTPVQAVVSAPTFDPAAGLWAGCHVVPDRWVIESNAGDTGHAYDWLVGLLVHGAGDRYALAERLAREPLGRATLAYIGPTIFDLSRMRPSRPGGILFPFPALHLRPGAGELLHAFLASVGFALRGNLEQLQRVTGRWPNRLVVGGGMARNALLLELLANITGLPIQRAEEFESAALGCAMLVAVGAGLYPDMAAATRVMTRHRSIEPDPDQHDQYGAPYAKWRELYDALGELSV